MSGYLLDTNIVSDLVRQPQGRSAQRLARLADERICTSIVVASELRYGAAKAASPRLTKQLELILSALEVLPLDAPADRHYADVRLGLEKAGTPIGPNDLLIAAHALAMDMTLVTGNTREFARVSGLHIENWLD